jgi:ADP-ribosylglycohydrolase
MPDVRETTTMPSIPFATYRDKVHGMWIGKFVGGTAGAPVEGIKEVHRFGADQLLPKALAENDDTDLQLLWLHALEEYGPGLDAGHLAREWREHVDAPWCEYGVAAHNLAQGIPPPDCGRVNNWFFGENMGCPIRSEIWGAICPGAPAQAARLAGLDASLDHFGVAVDAERFLAAIEAALFTESDLGRLIAIGLEHCDVDGRFARMVRDVVRWQRELPWRTVRERILQDHGDPCSLHALPNLGFTVLGLLEARGDFATAITCALNCGYDTDCTAATAGAIIGGILGASGIPDRFRNAVPPTYAISGWMLGFPRQGRLDELTDATCAMGLRTTRELATGTVITGAPADLRPTPLAVVAQPQRLTVSIPRTRPTWRIAGPYTAAWAARRKADGDHGSSAMVAHMPSMAYITHIQPAFGTASPDALFAAVPDLGTAQLWTRTADEDRLPLAGIPRCDIACSVLAGSVFSCREAHAAWLMIGSTGPVRVWLNGREVLVSESYQQLAPTTFAIRVSLQAGANRLALELARTSQPLGAYVAVKADTGKHWHQEFFDGDLRWLDTPWPA